MSIPDVMSNGAAIPAVGFGTWPLKGDECEMAVRTALDAGYRHIDTAAMYGNEAEVGRGIKASGKPRDSVWITTKVWQENIGAGRLQASAEASLKALGVSQIDLLLIHWPNESIPLSESIAALCDAKKRGYAKTIGVSNFPTKLLREAVKLSTEPLVTNQIEYHPHLDQRVVLDCARELGISVTSYCPLGRGMVGGVLGEPAVQAIATAKGKTAAQVVLKWHLQQGLVVVPKSATPARIRENIDLDGFSLSADEMTRINGLARPDGRVVKMASAPQWD